MSRRGQKRRGLRWSASAGPWAGRSGWGWTTIRGWARTVGQRERKVALKHRSGYRDDSFDDPAEPWNDRVGSPTRPAGRRLAIGLRPPGASAATQTRSPEIWRRPASAPTSRNALPVPALEATTARRAPADRRLVDEEKSRCPALREGRVIVYTVAVGAC